MAIFTIKNKKLTELKSKIFPTERELQNLVDENLDKIFGLEFIKREFGGQGLSIDTIAYDPETKSPVLIEYKKDSYQSVVDQGMAYLHWLLTHKGDYQVALTEKIGKREIDWSQPRVIFIAKSFNPHQVWASGFRNAPFELYRYDFCGDVFLLEPVETPRSDISITSVLKTKEAKKVTQQVKTYALEDHLTRGSQKIRELFEKLQKGIFILDERIQEKPVKFYIGYKIRYYNFCAVHIFRDRLYIDLRTKKINDPKKIFKEVYPAKQDTYASVWRAIVSSDKDFDYILGIIKQSYQNAPDL
jgi:predicted transport protein